MRPDCDLCKVLENGEGENVGNFFILVCRTHNQPMLVLKEHKASLSANESQEAIGILKARFNGKRFRGHMGEIKNHWHEHVI